MATALPTGPRLAPADESGAEMAARTVAALWSPTDAPAADPLPFPAADGLLTPAALPPPAVDKQDLPAAAPAPAASLTPTAPPMWGPGAAAPLVFGTPSPTPPRPSPPTAGLAGRSPPLRPPNSLGAAGRSPAGSVSPPAQAAGWPTVGRAAATPSRNLFVASFPKAMRDAGLRALFAQFGAIESCKVMLDIYTGAPRGFAFVLFRDVAAAVAAQRALDGRLVVLVPPPIDAAAADAPFECGPGGPWAALWRPGMATAADGSAAVPAASPAPSPAPSGSTSPRLAAAAAAAAPGGARLVVSFAKHDAFNVITASTKVYCRNIPTAMTEPRLREFFCELGLPPTALSILPDSEKAPPKYTRDGPPPLACVAFVEFGHTDAARRAVEQTYQTRLPGAAGPLLTKLAETASVRQERRKRQQAVASAERDGPRLSVSPGQQVHSGARASPGATSLVGTSLWMPGPPSGGVPSPPLSSAGRTPPLAHGPPPPAAPTMPTIRIGGAPAPATPPPFAGLASGLSAGGSPVAAILGLSSKTGQSPPPGLGGGMPVPRLPPAYAMVPGAAAPPPVPPYTQPGLGGVYAPMGGSVGGVAAGPRAAALSFPTAPQVRLPLAPHSLSPHSLNPGLVAPQAAGDPGPSVAS